MDKINLRKYGTPPFAIVVVHGGPGAAGEMAPVAKGLSTLYGILEPLQTANTLKGQIKELQITIEENGDPPVVLIGWSWGAWLSYLVAVYYPSLVKKIILVSSGPFEEKYTKNIMQIRLGRLSLEEKQRVREIIPKLGSDKMDERLFKEFGMLMDKADTFAPITSNDDAKIKFQPEIYESVWNEASKLRTSGKLLELGKRITCRVIAIHGDYDPHPTEGVRKPLSQVLNNFRFILIKHCGHRPWYEKEAKEKFYEVLKAELNGSTNNRS